MTRSAAAAMLALRSITWAIAIAWVVSGCSQSSGSPSSPTQSTAPKIAPNVTDVIPSSGSTGGGASLKIVGTGFQSGMVAMFDGIKVTGRFDSRDTLFRTFYTETPAHSIGAVDVVVTNPDGQSQHLGGRYTYAPQESFNLNGVWNGFTDNGTDTAIGFVIQGDRLVSASCAYDAATPFSFSRSPSVQNGEFSLIADDGATLSGRIVSPSEIVGSVNFSACIKTPLTWRVNRTNN